HRSYALRAQREAIEQGRSQPLGACIAYVLAVSGQEARSVALDRGSYRQQRLVLSCSVGLSYLARSLARFAPDAVHVRLNIHPLPAYDRPAILPGSGVLPPLGQPQTELEQLVPDVAAREPFDHPVDC